jgi:hypothetical protein
MAEKPTMQGLSSEYLESMRAYVDEGGQLSHANALELLDEVERQRNALTAESAVGAVQKDRTDRK